jgi:hypothetical protein
MERRIVGDGSVVVSVVCSLDESHDREESEQ